MLKFILSSIYFLRKLKYKEFPFAILYYHHLTNDIGEGLSEEEFDEQMKILSTYFNVVSLERAIQLRASGNLPPKTVAITFDDGYLDNLTKVVPILKKYDCPATFFISTEGTEIGYLWNDEVKALIEQTHAKMVSSEIIGKQFSLSTQSERKYAYQQLCNSLKFETQNARCHKMARLRKELGECVLERQCMTKQHLVELDAAGFEIGAHTHGHCILSNETMDICEAEIRLNLSKLKEAVGKKIRYFAYPNGLEKRDFQHCHGKLLKKLGFEAGFSTNDGGVTSKSGIFAMPRFMPNRRKGALFALAVAHIATEPTHFNSIERPI